MLFIYHIKQIQCAKLQAALFLAVFIFPFVLFSFVYAQEEGISQAPVVDPSSQEQRESLEFQLNQLEEELRKIHDQINIYRVEQEGFERDISLLDSEIRKLELQIQRNEVALAQTDLSIQTNEEAIQLLVEKIETQRELLSQLVLSIYKLGNTSSLEIVLTSDTLSEYFDDVERVEEVQEGLATTLDAVKEIKEQIQEEQIVLEGRVEEQIHVLEIQSLSRKQLAVQVGQKQVLEEESRSQEYAARETASETQRSINDIRNRLFVLSGGGDAITFGQAYELAKFVETFSGVRPAFLLSLIKQESGRGDLWGGNLGSCTWRQIVQGRDVMHPTRDQPAFAIIAAELGFNPDTQPVSCPWISRGVRKGYGGAMGPAQFIPSTWMGYKDRITNILGSVANPWNIRDAFLASGIKLADAGADARTYEKEFGAAMRYFSGGRWTHAEEHLYGEPVMNRAAQYQRDIDILEGN